MGVPETCLI